MATSDVAAFYAQMQIKFSPNRKTGKSLEKRLATRTVARMWAFLKSQGSHEILAGKGCTAWIY